MTSLASKHGFSSYKTIYDAGDNADLVAKRPVPARLVPGDVVTIPDKPTKEESAPAGKSTKFTVKRPKARAIIDLRVEGDFSYELTIDGATSYQGKTDGKKPIEHPIPPQAGQGELWVWPEKSSDGSANDAREGRFLIPILFGRLQPIDDPGGTVMGGVQGVLANLGHYAGPINGISNTDLEIAAVAFKVQHGLDPTTDIDAALTGKLKSVHG